MVITHRSSSDDAATTGIPKPYLAKPTRDTVHVGKSEYNRPVKAIPRSKLVGAAHNTIYSNTMSEHELSLVSHSTIQNSKDSTMSTSNQTSTHTGDATSSAQRRLAAKPSNASGGLLNPIILSDSSPPAMTTGPPRREHRKQKPKPHKFLGRGYRKLYSHRSPRPVLAPKPTKGSTFTGHRSHDIYRMMNAKMATASTWNTGETYGYIDHGFDIQYSIPAQVLAHQPNIATPMPSSYTQYYDWHARMNTGFMISSHNEEMLRKKAVQYVREYSRPSPHKKRLLDADPDETSTSESEYSTAAVNRFSHKLMPRLGSTSALSPTAISLLDTKSNLDDIPGHDSALYLAQLTELANLLTALLQVYPHSTDQKGLREDIAMVISVQNQCITEWTRSETPLNRKRRKLNVAHAISVGTDIASAVQPEISPQAHLNDEQHKRQDNEIRQFLSASADIWQDGSGQSVADVFTTVSSSSSVASLDGSDQGATDKTSSPAAAVLEKEA